VNVLAIPESCPGTDVAWGSGLAPFSEILIKDLLLIPKKVPVPVV
jgi:hypothetical protein